MRNLLKYFIIICFCFISNTIFSQKKWTLEKCIDHAKEHNLDVVKQKIRAKIIKSDIKIAKGNYLPDANLNASQNFSLGDSFNVSTGVGQRESSSNSFSLSSSLNIFNGFANKYKLQKSYLSKEKAEADINQIQFDLTLNIINKYLQVLFNKELLKVSEEQIKISKQNDNRLKSLYENGSTGKRELLEIKSTLATDTKEKILAENKVRNSLIELKELLDVNQLENFDIKEISIDALITKVNIITKEVIEKNPQIQSSKLDIELKKKDILLSKTSFYPRVNLNYSYSSNYFHIIGEEDVVFNQQINQNISNGFFTQLDNNRTHYVGISATIPLFNRYLTKENYKKSYEELKISEIELESNKQKLKNKIEGAQNDLMSSKAVVKSTKIAFQSQKEAFEIIQRQYTNGNVTNYEFLESKNKLIKNTSEHIKAKFDFYFKTKILVYYFSR